MAQTESVSYFFLETKRVYNKIEKIREQKNQKKPVTKCTDMVSGLLKIRH